MKIYRRLLSYARPFRWFLVPFTIFTLLAVVFSVFQFALIIPLLNVLFNPETGPENVSAPAFSLSTSFFRDIFYYQVHRLRSIHPSYALYFITFIIVCSVLLTNLFRYLAQRTLIKARTLLVKRIREALFEKINHHFNIGAHHVGITGVEPNITMGYFSAAG